MTPAMSQAWGAMNNIMGGSASPVDDQKLRKRIGWLNKNCVFADVLKYDDVKAAAVGVDGHQVMVVLKDLEEKKDTIKSPTAWVVKALKKRGAEAGVQHYPSPGPWMGGAPPQADNYQSYGMDYQVANYGGGGAMGGGPMGGGAMSGGAMGGFPMAIDGDTDQMIRKKVGWLNKNGFENSVNYKKVSEAAVGVDSGSVKRIFDDLESNREKIKDPTAYVAKALRNAAGGMKYPSPQFGGAFAGVKRTIMKR